MITEAKEFDTFVQKIYFQTAFANNKICSLKKLILCSIIFQFFYESFKGGV